MGVEPPSKPEAPLGVAPPAPMPASFSRCSLVFATAKDLADGLLMICKDNDVEIQSCNPLKQRFAIEYDDKISAGYRDVQLSVKIKTDENQKNGLAAEHHLCEVQLHLKSFYFRCFENIRKQKQQN